MRCDIAIFLKTVMRYCDAIFLTKNPRCDAISRCDISHRAHLYSKVSIFCNTKLIFAREVIELYACSTTGLGYFQRSIRICTKSKNAKNASKAYFVIQKVPFCRL